MHTRPLLFVPLSLPTCMCTLYTDEGVYIYNILYAYVKATCMSDMINKFPHFNLPWINFVLLVKAACVLYIG